MLFTYNDIINSFEMNDKDKKIKEEKITYKDYIIDYYTDGKILAIFDYDRYGNDLEKLVYFYSIDDLKDFIDHEVIEKHKTYYRDIYDSLAEKILLDYKDDIAYHVSYRNNRKSILENGLIYKKDNKFTKNIIEASKFLDKNKPNFINKKFKKSKSIYLSPQLNLINAIMENANIDVYAINIKDLDWYIGSINLSYNMLLYDYSDDSSQNNKLFDCKRYWDNCYTKQEYLENSKKIQDSIINYGLDEILIVNKIEKEKISHIINYDYSGNKLKVLRTNQFKNFVKDEYKKDLEKIIERIFCYYNN